jgi:hypothetical protein
MLEVAHPQIYLKGKSSMNTYNKDSSTSLILDLCHTKHNFNYFIIKGDVVSHIECDNIPYEILINLRCLLFLSNYSAALLILLFF